MVSWRAGDGRAELLPPVAVGRAAGAVHGAADRRGVRPGGGGGGPSLGGGADAAAAARGGGGAPPAQGGQGQHQLGLVHHGAGIPRGLLIPDHPLLRRPRRRGRLRQGRGAPGAQRPLLRRAREGAQAGGGGHRRDGVPPGAPGQAELRRHGRRGREGASTGHHPAGLPEPGPHHGRAEAPREAQPALHRPLQDRPWPQEGMHRHAQIHGDVISQPAPVN
jgi:hypothetical protein